MAIDHFGQFPLPQTDSHVGTLGVITYTDTEKPHRGEISVPVDSEPQLRGYLNFYRSNPSRYANLTWVPNVKIELLIED